MNTTELGDLLREATGGLEPAPDFAQQVLQGGRRRRLRRRLTVAASAVAVVAMAAGATVVALNDPAAPVSVADDRLTAPTKGDLAGDQKFLADAKEVWRTELTYAVEASFGFYDDRRGEPHVYWAGNTPSGPAAIVVQQIYAHTDNFYIPKEHDGLHTAEGVVAIDPADGKLKLVGTNTPTNSREYADYYSFGQGDRTLLILDQGKPLYYRYGTLQEGTGQWQRARPKGGVALVQLPEGIEGMSTTAFQGDHPPDDPPDNNTDRVRQPLAPGCVASVYLQGRLSDPNYRAAVPEFLPWKETWTFGTPVSEFNSYRMDIETSVDRLNSSWMIIVGFADRAVLLRETQIEKNLSRLTVAVGTYVQAQMNIAVVDGGEVDKNAVLPVKFRIPDGGGWIVAQRGQSLSYRTAPDGQWQDAGKDAALLPDNAIEVKVGDQVVAL